MNFILFPNQLFELKYISKEFHSYNFYLIDHKKFYGLLDTMNFNKKKLVLHKASCLAYVDSMSKKINIELVADYPKIKNSTIIFFDAVDHTLNNEVFDFYQKLGNQVTMLETPNFMTNSITLEQYYNKHKKSNFIHSHFYNFQIKLHKIPYIEKSYDVENRNPLPENIKIPVGFKKNIHSSIKKAISFVNKEFKKNYGTTDNFYLPVTHDQAKKFFNLFLKKKAEFFAEYQDSIVPEQPFLFHSVISSSINIGLLNPDYVIEHVIKAYKAKKMSLKDYEAFIRQIIGWREYQRFIYLFLAQEIISKNYFGNTRKLTKHWYQGTLGIPPVDDAIIMAFDYGYLHHILRLMVMCNFMNLCQLHPYQVYTWMMEFSVDSYEWVMIGNVYSMGMWSDGGLTMRKPYISSDNYIQKMSGNRYLKGEWQDIWRSLYYNFLMKHRSKLKKTLYVRNLSHLDKIDKDQIREMQIKSNNFINSVTK